MNLRRKLFTVLVILTLLISASISAYAEPTTTATESIDILKPAFVLTDSDQQISDQPEVTLQSVDILDKPKAGTIVTIKDLNDAKIVIQGTTDKLGQFHFISNATNDFISKSVGDVAYKVYEVFFVSLEGELTRTVFSVPFVKDKSRVSLNDLKILEKGRDKNVVVKQSETKSKKLSLNKNSTKALVHTLGVVGTCDILGAGYQRCYTISQDYTQVTKVGSVNLASGEQVDFNLTSSAKVKLEAGYKRDSAAWSVTGSVGLSNDTSTSVDYSFGGTCAYYGSTFTCNSARNVYANYSFHYDQAKMYQYNVLQWTENTVTPTGLVGSNTTSNYSIDSNNGRSVSSVTSNQYGLYFQVGYLSSTTKSYSTERTFGGGFTVSTPVGSFSGGVTTQYANSHSIKWYVPSSSSTVYYHYDYGTSGGSYYVTS